MGRLVYFYMFILVSSSIFFSTSHSSILLDSGGVRFCLYPFKRAPKIFQELTLNPKSIRASHFIPGVKTVIIIHGFWPNLTRFTPLEIKNVYLQQNTTSQQNTIYLDWSYFSTPSRGILLSYPIIVFRLIPYVAAKLADFLLLLIHHGFVEAKQIQLIGYSLGAHLAGLCGQLVQQKGVTIGRIFGLDPALPLFQNVFGTHRLNRKDAGFVQIIHTAMQRMGWMKATFEGDGDVDFYPNGGRSPQPGCLLIDLKVPILCSHLFSVQLFMESIRRNITACKCQPMIDFRMTVLCLGGCRTQALLGDKCAEGTSSGQYHLTTDNIIPDLAPLLQ